MTESMKTQTGRKWLRIGLIAGGGLVLLLVSLVAFAPAIAASGWGRGIAEARIAEAVNGSARIGSMSLGWFGKQEIRGLEIRDGKGQSELKLDLALDNGLFDLLLGSVDAVRVSLSGSLQGQMLAGGGTSLSNFAPASSTAAPAAPAAKPSSRSGAKAGGVAVLPWPVRLTIGSFDAVMRDASGVAFAMRGLKGSVALGPSEPLAIDLSATTQVADQSGALSVKGSLDHFMDASGAFDPRELTGEIDASVSGWLIMAAGLDAKVQGAALRVQAPAGKPIGLAMNAAVELGGSSMSAQAQMSAARPAAGADIVAWASDPRTWIGQATVKNVPTAALQRFVKDTPIVLARDVGPTVDLSLQTGEGAGVNLSLTSQRVQAAARAIVDSATGAMQGDGITLQATLDPALLAQFGTTVDAPLQVSASVPSLRTPPIPSGGSMDVAGVAVEASVQVQPFQMLGVAPAPIQVGALTLAAKGAPLGTQVDFTVQGSVQQAPIEVKGQVTGLGPALSLAAAQFRGTVAAGPLDPSVLPGLPAEIRGWITKAQPGASTLRASMTGSMQQGAAQAQLDTALGSVSVKPAWDATSVTVDKMEATVRLSPALVGELAAGQVAIASPVQVQLGAGPVRVARTGGVKFEPIPVRVQVPGVECTRVQGVAGPLSVQGVAVEGAVDPDGPALFDGSVSLASASAASLDGIGAVRMRGAAAKANLASDLKTITLTAKVDEVVCPAVPGLSGAVAVRPVQVTMKGTTDFGPGTTASFEAAAHDATGVIATVRGNYEPQATGWRASVQSEDVDMRRALGLLGQGDTLPDWVGTKGARSFAANVAGGAGGISFGVNASLDPIELQAQGSRTTTGTLALTKGSLKAKLPDSVSKALARQWGTVVLRCDPMQVSVTVNALTLPSDANGKIQPFAPGADMDLVARIEPWRVTAEGSPTLAFGTNELVLKSRAGTGASVKLTGSLGAEGTPAAPLDISLQTAQLLDAQGRFAPGKGSLNVVARVKDFPTGLADRLSGMDGSLVDMLGPAFTVDLSGRTGTTREDFFKATFTSPTLVVQAPVVRLGDGVLSIAPDAPMTAELRPDERFRERIMKPLNPIFADIETTQPIRASLQSLQMPLPVDVRAVQAALSIDIGEVAVRKSSQFLALLDYVVASPQKTIPVKFMPLPVRLGNGLLTYKDFHMFIGKLNKDTWQYPIFGEAQINLASEPPYADFIDIRYPYSAIAGTAGKFKGARDGLAKVDKWLSAVPGAKDVVNSLQQKVRYSGPLSGGELQMEFFPIHLPDSVGGKILDGVQKGIGNAIDDLFGKKK